LNRIVLIYFVLLIGSFSLQYFQAVILEVMGQKVMLDLRTHTFRHIQGMSLSFFNRNALGKLIARLVNDVEALHELITQGVVAGLGDLLRIFGTAAILFYWDWRLALIVFSFVPVLLFATWFYRLKARDAYRKTRKYVADINSELQENAAGAATVQMFNREELSFRRFEKANRGSRNEQLRTVYYNALYFPLIDLMAACSIAAVIWYGGGRSLQNLIPLGVLVAFIQYILPLFGPIRDFAQKYNILQSALAACERIFEVMDQKTEIENPPLPVRGERARGRIEFKNVWFSYNSDEPVLKDISFRLDPGESVAIVGPTGAGKTSLINLLNRMYDIQRGEILLDGVDIRTMDKYHLRSQIGIVLQDAFLFADDVVENVRLGNGGITPDRVREICREIRADPFIQRLAGTYDHKLMERGTNLSLGQRQLLAFARVFAYDPPILVLDEATSSLDSETEHLVQEALLKTIRGRTSILIAHRLSTIRFVDKIIVLRHGRIEEMGTHQELIRQKGIYQHLYSLQYQS
jgi:ABC-type multidrug transport system fused ATPase/permease subunit